MSCLKKFSLVIVFLSYQFNLIAQDPALQWAKSFGGSLNDEGLSIFVDDSGNVYTTGFFRGTGDFDPGPGVFNLTPEGFDDIFVQKLDSSGNLVWAKSFGGTSNEAGLSIGVDATGNVYTTGLFRGTVDFDPGSGIFNLSSSGSEDIFVQKMDASGNFLWAKSFGGNSNDNGISIFIDEAENVYTTGEFQDTVDFDPGPGISNVISNGDRDIFYLKLTEQGDFSSIIQIGSNGDDRGGSVQVDNTGNSLLLGRFSSTVDFNPSPNVNNHISNGSLDMFVLKLDSQENYLWSRSFGGISPENGFFDIGIYNHIYIAGNFQFTVDFNPNPGINNLTASGMNDIFAMKLIPPCLPNSGFQNITSCDSYLWPANSQTYASTGLYNTTLTIVRDATQ